MDVVKQDVRMDGVQRRELDGGRRFALVTPKGSKKQELKVIKAFWSFLSNHYKRRMYLVFCVIVCFHPLMEQNTLEFSWLLLRARQQNKAFNYQDHMKLLWKLTDTVHKLMLSISRQSLRYFQYIVQKCATLVITGHGAITCRNVPLDPDLWNRHGTCWM